jgi:hypothetical protein
VLLLKLELGLLCGVCIAAVGMGWGLGVRGLGFRVALFCLFTCLMPEVCEKAPHSIYSLVGIIRRCEVSFSQLTIAGMGGVGLPFYG